LWSNQGIHSAQLTKHGFKLWRGQLSLKPGLQSVKDAGNTSGASLPCRLKLKLKGAGILGIDAASHKPFRFERRHDMADVAACGFEGASQIRGTNIVLLQKDRSKHQRFGEREAFLLQCNGQRGLDAPGKAASLKDDTLCEKLFDAHP